MVRATGVWRGETARWSRNCAYTRPRPGCPHPRPPHFHLRRTTVVWSAPTPRAPSLTTLYVPSSPSLSRVLCALRHTGPRLSVPSPPTPTGPAHSRSPPLASISFLLLNGARRGAAPPSPPFSEYIQHMLSENYQFQWSRCCMVVNNGNLTTLGCEGKCILHLIPSSTDLAWHPTHEITPPSDTSFHTRETACSCARFAHSLRSLAHRRQNSSPVFRPLPALRTSLLAISPRRIPSSEKERTARGLRPCSTFSCHALDHARQPERTIEHSTRVSLMITGGDDGFTQSLTFGDDGPNRDRVRV